MYEGGGGQGREDRVILVGWTRVEDIGWVCVWGGYWGWYVFKTVFLLKESLNYIAPMTNIELSSDNEVTIQ